MAKKEYTSSAADVKQQQLEAAKKKADQSSPFGQQPHDIAERANMKRQQKKMHEQDNK